MRSKRWRTWLCARAGFFYLRIVPRIFFAVPSPTVNHGHGCPRPRAAFKLREALAIGARERVFARKRTKPLRDLTMRGSEKRKRRGSRNLVLINLGRDARTGNESTFYATSRANFFLCALCVYSHRRTLCEQVCVCVCVCILHPLPL